MSSVTDIIKIPFGWLLNQLYQMTNSYGVALILFALLVKLVLLPMSMKSKKSTMKMSRLAPQIKALEVKYAGDKQKYQMEVMKLQQENGVSATGGCLWSIIPLVVLIILYQVIRSPMVYMMGFSAEQAEAIVAAAADSPILAGTNAYYHQMVIASRIQDFLPAVRQVAPELANAALSPINFSFLGIDLGMVPDWKFWAFEVANWATVGLFLTPIISAGFQYLTMIFSQKLNSSVTTNEKGEKVKDTTSTAQSMKMMNILMPVMSLWIGYSMPASMSIYWIAQAVFGLVQEIFLTNYYRKIYDEEDELRRQQAAEQAAIEAEKARLRAERREKLGDVADPNTSKKKLAAKEKAERGPVVEGKLTPEEREALRQVRNNPDGGCTEECPSGIPDRPYCKGRSYKPRRYGRDNSVLIEEEAPGGEEAPDEESAEALSGEPVAENAVEDDSGEEE